MELNRKPIKTQHISQSEIKCIYDKSTELLFYIFIQNSKCVHTPITIPLYLMSSTCIDCNNITNYLNNSDSIGNALQIRWFRYVHV